MPSREYFVQPLTLRSGDILEITYVSDGDWFRMESVRVIRLNKLLDQMRYRAIILSLESGTDGRVWDDASDAWAEVGYLEGLIDRQ